MKRTTIWTAGTLLSLLPVLASVSFAGSHTSIRLGAAVFTQAPSKKPTISRRDVDRLLAQARSAIRNRRFDEAEQLIARAERSGISYSIFHVGDSPKKARRALARARSQAVSQQLPEQTNPFERQNAGAVEMNIFSPPAPALDRPRPTPSGRITGLEAVEASDRLDVPTLQQAAGGRENARPESDARIRAARLALAVGDTRRAEALVVQAKQYGIPYQLGDDSPAKVEAAIAKFKQVLQNRAVLRRSPEWRRHYSKVLYEQAEALFRWGELDEAERLALDAAQLGGTLDPSGAPQGDLLQRIAAARRAKTAASTFPAPAKATLRLATPPNPPVDTAPLSAIEPPPIDPPVPPSERGGNEVTDLAKQQSLVLLAQARDALARNDVPRAEQLAMQASSLNVPETEFASGEDRPSSVALAVHAAQMNAAARPADVAENVPQGSPSSANEQSLYEPENDPTRDVRAAGEGQPATVRLVQNAPDPLPAAPDAAPVQVGNSDADRLLAAGEEALRDQKMESALEFFRQAYDLRDQLDPLAQQRLQGRLQMLSGGAPARPTPRETSLIDAATDRERLLIRQISADLTKKQTGARQLRERDPEKALGALKDARRMVEKASINEAARTQLLRRVDTSIGETEAYIKQNRAQLELDAKNQSIKDEINRDRAVKVQVQDKIAQLVDQFNELRDEQRYAEAEVVGRRLYELDPDEPVVKQVWREAKIIRRERLNQIVIDEKESANYVAMLRNEQASAMMDPDNPIEYGDAHVWDELTQRRRDSARKRKRHRNERELEIERRLKMPVQLQYTERPLAEVIDGLAELSGINVHLDPAGIDQEGIRSDTPVTINLRNEISLESALNLILTPLHLSYVIKNEVLMITSEALRDDEVYQMTYDVADLVIPIPNFAPSANMGLQGLINDAHASLGYGGFSGYGGLGMPGPTATVVNNGRHPLQKGGDLDQNALAQQMTGLPGMAPRPTVPVGGGPGGMGGGTQADFDALIELITSTVHPDSWDENGGPGSMREFETNLSLVVSQTQEVHEEIADLLDQLRRLQDLQVTIEVRFITLSDQFFERIGVDFDFNIEDGPAVLDPRPTAGMAVEGRHPSSTVGLNPPPDISLFPNFTADLDLPFRDESFGLAVAPTFANPVEVASFGFAILSEIEAYFLINASQGDRRSNILEAPKVTLFNGQLALVTDTVQRPFVISVIPVVGDFAAAQQPVIVVLSEGTFLSIQAVVTEDRRYVRLTVVPFFSQIGDVETFTFEGTTRSSSSSSSRDNDDDMTVESAADSTEIRSGTTVQQPTFEIVAVSTTVSVPDGGTVLLGGVKRLSEGRNEFGVPLLSKVPYVNRLFRNVGIGRSTQSLMMMVTPRIIIQEEEEERLGVISE